MLPKQPYQYSMWIDGRWVGSHSGKEFTRESPAHETLVGRYPLAEEADADAAVAAARRAFDEGPWPRMTGTFEAFVAGRRCDPRKHGRAGIG